MKIHFCIETPKNIGHFIRNLLFTPLILSRSVKCRELKMIPTVAQKVPGLVHCEQSGQMFKMKSCPMLIKVAQT